MVVIIKSENEWNNLSKCEGVYGYQHNLCVVFVIKMSVCVCVCVYI